MTKYYYISTSVKYLTALLEILLGARIFLKFLGANSKAQIVKLLYLATDFIIAPFKSIFPNVALSEEEIIDVVSLSAMVGYFILMLLVLKFLKFIFIRPISNDSIIQKSQTPSKPRI